MTSLPPVFSVPVLQDLQASFLSLRTYFDQGKTLNISDRKILLQKLYDTIEAHSEQICNAAFADFHKPKAEMLLTEVYTVLAEIKNTIGYVEQWAKPQRASTNILLLPSRSKIYRSPKGVVLIISPWNYSFYLCLMPLVAAIAAGNVVLLKPAHETPKISQIIKDIVDQVFPKEHVTVILGQGKATGELLLQNFIFNHIFFTGSAPVGKWIMQQAAKNLTPVTLELGGKSPAIVASDANIDLAAQKIVWGKFINSGQTCVCADYVVVHHSIKEKFVAACIKQIKSLYGEDVFSSDQYCHMIHDEKFDQVVKMLEDGQVIYGGKHDKSIRCIEPTLIVPHSMDTKLMKDEIFGPLLPILAYESKEELLSIVRKNRYPLALYLFTQDNGLREFVTSHIEFGGGCFNNTVYHLGNPNLPFGGIQYSGMGHYHGKTGFDAFSNVKSILQNANWFNPPLMYQPYTPLKLKILKRFFNM